MFNRLISNYTILLHGMMIDNLIINDEMQRLENIDGSDPAFGQNQGARKSCKR